MQLLGTIGIEIIRPGHNNTDVGAWIQIGVTFQEVESAESYARDILKPGLFYRIRRDNETVLTSYVPTESAEDKRNIANAATLLSHIAEGLQDLEKEQQRQINSRGHIGVSPIKLEHIGVTFYEGGGDTGEVVWDGGLATALDFLSNDTYWDENRNWAGADTASVSYG